jgi:2-polyprenyl-3-methyl-5-hydroxy-6-metoxy-1,4-benzoquinol methylase
MVVKVVASSADSKMVDVSNSSREARLWGEAKEVFGNERLALGPYFTFIVRNSPRRLLHLLSYYKFAAKMIGVGKRVVDVGCSEGFGTILLAEHAASCVGMDLDRDAIAIANATVASAKLTFEVADVLHDDIGRFDAAVALDVIEHIYQENEDAFVGALAAALSDDGLLILGTPNVTADRYASEHARRGHVNLFDADRLRELGLRHFRNVLSFSANDEMVHTGFSPMAHYLFVVCAGPRRVRA